MAKRRPTFPEPSCRSCEKHHSDGKFLYETRYCMGVKSKKGKRFKKSDPQFKPPRWCPKRIAPVCRIYSLVGERARFFDLMRRNDYDEKKGSHLIPSASDYRLRLEMPAGMTAREFYEAVQHDSVTDVLADAAPEYGDIIEIDNGLKPYYFYYLKWSTVVPVAFFDKSRTQEPV